MYFELFCSALIALFFGLLLCFAGYRLFIVLLPIWGFFAGFALGAHSLQLIFSGGLLGDVTSWVVGFVVGAIFAVLSYLFYLIGVAIFAGTVGYGIGIGIMDALGVDPEFLTWLVGIVLGVILALVVLRFNIQKWVIIAATAIGGTGIILGVLMFGYGTYSVLEDVFTHPVKLALQSSESIWWTLLGIVLVVLGIVGQIRTTRDFVLEPPPNKI